ncbi:uncharacterized protein BKCO1_4600077 [Diplodia corticola]|uniref:DUF7924 domain-containing protein n=1 Tax=Diplodia corticola TaxID=236234 RepID=A0A1J9QT85_9PEZI|nr:uncharacterized protein BKCO1_4600077 [Diplodia corticola]OJD31648.1 hypothetical protein BKCO1_4600077 [Diplodia corticola]
MARAYRSASAKNHQGCCSASLARAERPQGIRKSTPIRRSARLQQRLPPEQVHQSFIVHDSNGQDAQLQSTTIQSTERKRKRSPEIDTSDRPAHKRQRPSPTTTEALHEETASESGDSNNPIDYWRKHLHWPRQFFESGSKMSHLLARKKSTSALRRKSSASSINSSDTTPTQSDQIPREAKSMPYRDARYETLLEAKNSFLRRDDAGVKKEAKKLCRDLLETEQAVPEDTLFSDDIFEETCEMMRKRNEARLVRDITLLIVPSAEIHMIRRPRHSRILVETVNEGWNSSIPVTSPRPQPDYSAGFRREAFTADQLKLLGPFVGTLWDESYFAATWYMYFPFLTCEVKCGAAALDIADRQNAHSATLAVRAVVELFRLVKREQEIDREILAFSVSHDHRMVRIYGHYPVLDGRDTKYYRHLIHTFDFTAIDGREKWTTYKFTKNVYDNWMPDHFKRICSAIDEIPPDISFDVSQESELQFSRTGLSQDLESQRPSQVEGSASVAGDGSVSSVANANNTTPNTSVSQSFKKPRRL